MKIAIGLLATGVLGIITLFSISFLNSVHFDQNCGGYLKRAADANTIELAKGELKKALDYIEENDLKEGNTAVFWNRPENDLEFWYNNIKSSYDELLTLNDSTSGLEKSNMLIKLRETLIDHSSKSGDSVTLPPRIKNYPSHFIISILFYLSLLLTGLGFTFIWYKSL